MSVSANWMRRVMENSVGMGGGGGGGDKETRRQGDKETRRQGDKETRNRTRHTGGRRDSRASSAVLRLGSSRRRFLLSLSPCLLVSLSAFPSRLLQRDPLRDRGHRAH